MKITSVILGLSFFIAFVMGENDCDVFKGFFSKQGYSLECCGNSIYVLCDDNNKIKSITLDSEIMNNFYKPISLDDFPIFPELQHLTLTNAGDITADPINGVFPMHLFNLPKLEVLEIMSFNIRNITGIVNTNNNIKTINLCNNNIEKFPYQFKTLPKLSHLDMSLNELRGSLSNEIKEFHSLKYLNIDTNELEGELIIPDSLEHITAVENKFTTFSASNSLENLLHIEAITNLFDDNIFRSLMKSNKLKTLTLGFNKNIRTIPDNIYQLNSLENLDLSATSISMLPNNFFALSNLHYLNLADNKNLKNSMVVSFGNPINVCDFTNTELVCYQPETCSFVFGYNDYRHCYDYEINQRHIFKEEVTEYFKEKKSDNHLVKYLIIIGISCLVLIFLGCIGYYIKKLFKRKLDEKVKKELELEEEIENNNNNDNNIKVTFTNMDGNDNSLNPLIKKNSSKIYSPHNGVGRSNSVDPTVFTNIDTNIATVQSNLFEGNMDDSNIDESNILGRNILGSSYIESNYAETTYSNTTTIRGNSIQKKNYYISSEPLSLSTTYQIKNTTNYSLLKDSTLIHNLPISSTPRMSTNTSAFYNASEFSKINYNDENDKDTTMTNDI